MIRFIDRKTELEVLESTWRNRQNSFIVLYGRRRIGKTTLLREFTKDKKGFFFVAEDTIKTIQLEEFKKSIASYLDDDFLSGQKIESWSALFSYLSKVIDKNKKFFIWIDEFSYLIKNDASLLSVMQKFIDHTLRDSRICLMVSGSLFGIMKEDILSHSSPLYGRRTKEILLEEIPAGSALEFFSDMSFKDSIHTLMVCGGVPEYLLVAQAYGSFNDFAQEEFFRKEGYFFRELIFLLSTEFREIRTYFSILNAIGYGNVKPGDIANFIGMNARKIYPYLELLITHGLIRREVAFDRPKEGLYFIKDPFIDFWFNFVYKNRASIEGGIYKPSVKDFSDFFGKRFEELIKSNLHIFVKKGFNHTSRWWYKEVEIDIVAINDHLILFSECKWQDRVNAEKICKELEEKSRSVKYGSRKKELAIFAKSFSKRMSDHNGMKVYCFDMEDMKKVFGNKNL